MNFTASDEHWMGRALALARRALYTTTPNPRVGCVLVRQGLVAGEGWHQWAGQAHAEVMALTQARAKAEGSTAYITLEPCAHVGRTPPCVEALINARVARVIVAMEDPNPLVRGQGLAALRAAGIEVKVGLLAEQAWDLNRGFIKRMTQGLPWVRLKMAASLDGFTALQNGQSQWITSEAARADGHHWRAQACAILTGIGTVQADNPQLNVRERPTRRQPIKVLMDSSLSVDVSANIFEGAPTWIFCARTNPAKAQALLERGCRIFECPNDAGRVDLAQVIQTLGEQGLNEIHVEAGSVLSGALMKSNLVDELLLYLAPSFLGAGRAMFQVPPQTDLAGVRRWRFKEIQPVGEDLRILGRLAAS